MKFRQALPDEAGKLTQIAIASKRHWNYTDEQIEGWTDALTVHPDFIKENMLILAEDDSEILGFISLIKNENLDIEVAERRKINSGYFLEWLFIHPSHIGKGIGEKLFKRVVDWCRNRNIEEFFVFSDPNAKGFYEKMGGSYLGNIVYSKTSRPLPLFVITL